MAAGLSRAAGRVTKGRGRRVAMGGCRRALAALAATLSPPLGVAAVAGNAAPPATLANPAITESSGLAASGRAPGVLWTHNDSDGPILYATDRQGRARGTFAVVGAANVDWEDLAIGPGAAGAAGADALYVADTGDNARQRDDPTIYRVAEPAVPDDPTQTTTALLTTLPAERFPLVFPNGPRDVEALLVDPATGEVVPISKEPSGDAIVYAAALIADEPTVLARVGARALPGFGPAKAITGGAVSADGRLVALRTPFAAYEWRPAPGASLADTFARPPRSIALPASPRGEAIAYDADGVLLLTSEGSPCPLYAVATDGGQGSRS